MFVVDLAFVAQEAAGVCEAWEFRAARDRAFVGTVMLIHVLSENAKLVGVGSPTQSLKRFTYDHSHFLPKSLTASSHPGQLHT